MTTPFKPTLLALAALALAQGAAHAQTQVAPSTLEAVTVTGQAASWRKALAIERKALGVVSAISADDIGACPTPTLPRRWRACPASPCSATKAKAATWWCAASGQTSMP